MFRNAIRRNSVAILGIVQKRVAIGPHHFNFIELTLLSDFYRGLTSCVPCPCWCIVLGFVKGTDLITAVTFLGKNLIEESKYLFIAFLLRKIAVRFSDFARFFRKKLQLTTEILDNKHFHSTVKQCFHRRCYGMCFKIKRPHSKRPGWAGRPLALQYKGEKESSNLRQLILLPILLLSISYRDENTPCTDFFI